MQDDGVIKRVDINTEGTAATFTTVYTTADHKLTAPLGMAFGHDGTMYLAGNEISDTNSSYATAVLMKGVRKSPDSEERTWDTLASTELYSFGHVYNHKTNALIEDTSHTYIYMNNGAATDHGEMREGHREVGLTSVILKIPEDTMHVLLKNDREWLKQHGFVLAEGVRNTFDLAYAGNGDLFGPENSDDRDDPEELNWIREGHHYGFPWRIGGDNTPQQYYPYDPTKDPLLSPNAWGGGFGQLYSTYSNDSTYPAPPEGLVFTEPVLSYGPDADKFRDTTTGDAMDASELGKTVSTFTPHLSVDGIVFDKDSVLAGDLKGGGFVTSFSRSGLITNLGDTSQNVMHIALTKEGDHYTAHVTKLVTGFDSPLGIEMVDNKLYVVETGLQYPPNAHPALWEITLPTTVTDVKGTTGSSIPSEFVLGQNYPNPFNPVTTIHYSLPQNEFVQLTIFDVLGREIERLVNAVQTAGTHTVQFDGSNLDSGIYYYVMNAANRTDVKKMVLIK